MDHIGSFDKGRIDQIAGEIVRRTRERRDYVVPRSRLALEPSGERDLTLLVQNGEAKRYPVKRSALLQVLGSLDFPARFADDLIDRGHVDLVAANASELLSREGEGRKGEPRKHLVRVLDGKADAFLSDSYRAIPNDAVMAVALQEFEKAGVEVWDLRLTDTEFRVLAVAPGISGRVTTDRNFAGASRWEGKEGDVLNAAISIGNSETGHGRFYGKVSILRRVCQNFCIWGDGVQRVHLGKKLEEGEHLWTSEETKSLEDQALVSKLRDVVKTAFSPAAFQKVLDEINQTTTRDLGEASATEVVDASIRLHGLPFERREAIIERLLKSGDRTQWGAVNAITAEANPENAGDLPDEVRSIVEDAGGAILRLSERGWKSFLHDAIKPKEEVEERAVQTVQRVR